MNNLSLFSQYYTTTSTHIDPEIAASVGFFMFCLAVVVFALVYAIYSVFLGRIFKKVGIKSWIAWVPFYSNWKMLEMGGQHGIWSVLSLIPFVSYVATVFFYIAMYHIGLKFGKSGTWVVLAIFLPLVWLGILAYDSSKWHGTKPAA
jgi:hypothetical protein